MSTEIRRGVLEHILPIGRYDDRDPDQIRFAWSGSGMSVRFEGSSLEVLARGSNTWLNISIDDQPNYAVRISPESDWTVLVQGLEVGSHAAKITTRTEPLVGEFVVSGLSTDGRFLPPPAPRGIRIEFVGDSITCGYGNLAPDETHSFDPATEDFARSYAGLVAAELEADIQCLAWSGLGAVRNFDIEPSPTLLERHRYGNPISKSDWDVSRWTPDVVVVNLGSNDFYRLPPPDPGHFRGALAGFIESSLQRAPAAKIVLLDGPLLKDGFPVDDSGRALPSLSTVRDHLDRIAVGFPVGVVHRLSFSTANSEVGYGADWHPGLAQHRLNADELIGFLNRKVFAGARS